MPVCASLRQTGASLAPLGESAASLPSEYININSWLQFYRTYFTNMDFCLKDFRRKSKYFEDKLVQLKSSHIYIKQASALRVSSPKYVCSYKRAATLANLGLQISSSLSNICSPFKIVLQIRRSPSKYLLRGATPVPNICSERRPFTQIFATPSKSSFRLAAPVRIFAHPRSHSRSRLESLNRSLSREA